MRGSEKQNKIMLGLLGVGFLLFVFSAFLVFQKMTLVQTGTLIEAKLHVGDNDSESSHVLISYTYKNAVYKATIPSRFIDLENKKLIEVYLEKDDPRVAHNAHFGALWLSPLVVISIALLLTFIPLFYLKRAISAQIL